MKLSVSGIPPLTCAWSKSAAIKYNYLVLSGRCYLPALLYCWKLFIYFIIFRLMLC